MLYSPTNFLHSLAHFQVERARTFTPSVTVLYSQLSDDASKRDLWRGNAIEAQSNDPYSVLRIYGGPGSIKHPKPIFSVQQRTTGTVDDLVWGLAQVLFETLLEDDGQPMRMQLIDGFDADSDAPEPSDGQYMLVNVDFTQRPGHTGRDDRGRIVITANFDVGFYKVTQ